MIQLEFLLALLERLPQDLRHELLDSVCRIYPTLRHPKLAHDPIAVHRLESILKQRSGATVIHDGQGHAKAFLICALANSSREVNSGQQNVAGIIVGHASPWPPIPGVVQVSPYMDVRKQLPVLWSRLQEVNAGSLILLENVWNRISHPHAELALLAERCHVITSDELSKPEELVRRINAPVHSITATPTHEQPERIRVGIRLLSRT